MKSLHLLEHMKMIPNAVIKSVLSHAGVNEVNGSMSHNGTNGNSNVIKKKTASLHPNVVKSSNGVCFEDGLADFDVVSDGSKEEDETFDSDDNDEDLYNFESEDEHSDGNVNCGSDNDIIGEALSLAGCQERSTVNQIVNHDSTVLNLNHAEKSKTFREKGIVEKPEANNALKESLQHAGQRDINKRVKERAAILKDMQASIPSLLSSEPSNQHALFSKRSLDTTESVFDTVQKLKSRRIDQTHLENSSKSEFAKNTGHIPANFGLDENSFSKATSTAKLLSQSLKLLPNATSHSSWQNLSFGSVKNLANGENRNLNKNLHKIKLTAYLNQDGDYFQIGNVASDDLDYKYSVTIIYAENLSQVLQNDAASEFKNYQFCYSFLGCPIHTDSFSNLDYPELSSEKATASIRSTSENLSEFFNQHSLLPIHLMTEGKCVALCTVDLKKLVSIAEKEDIKLEGVFDVYGIGLVTHELENMSNQCTAKLAVCIELALDKQVMYYSNSLPGNRSKNSMIREENCNIDCSDVGNSMSSDSETEWNSSKHKRKKQTRSEKRFCVSCSKRLSESEKESHYLQLGEEISNYKTLQMKKARLQVKEWKNERRKSFEKERGKFESSILENITSECQKLSEIEMDLNYRLAECDRLKQQLISGINDLTLKEEALHSREMRVARLEEELNTSEISKQHNEDKNSEKENPVNHVEKTILQNKRTRQLQLQIGRLQEDYVKAESAARELALENVDLKRQLLESDNFIGVVKEKDILTAKVATLQERKQHYKEQWMKAISDMHMYHTNNKKVNNQISANSVSHEHYPQIGNETHNGNKLKKLKDERKILIDSGKFTPDDSIIKNIDKKIRTLVIGSSK